MDLRHATVVARNVATWILNALGAVLLLWAIETYGKPGSAGDERPPVGHCDGRHAHPPESKDGQHGPDSVRWPAGVRLTDRFMVRLIAEAEVSVSRRADVWRPVVRPRR